MKAPVPLTVVGVCLVLTTGACSSPSPATTMSAELLAEKVRVFASTRPNMMSWTVVADCGDGEIEATSTKIVRCEVWDEDVWHKDDPRLAYEARVTFNVTDDSLPTIEIEIDDQPKAS